MAPESSEPPEPLYRILPPLTVKGEPYEWLLGWSLETGRSEGELLRDAVEDRIRRLFLYRQIGGEALFSCWNEQTDRIFMMSYQDEHLAQWEIGTNFADDQPEPEASTTKMVARSGAITLSMDEESYDELMLRSAEAQESRERFMGTALVDYLERLDFTQRVGGEAAFECRNSETRRMGALRYTGDYLTVPIVTFGEIDDE